MKHVAWVPLILIAGLGTARAAPVLTNQQVLEICANASPTPSPPGWQDFFFEATGKVTRTSRGYTLKGKENGASGTCVITDGKEEAIFTFDDANSVLRASAAAIAPQNFARQCHLSVLKLAGQPDRVDTGEFNLAVNDSRETKSVGGGKFEFSASLFSEPYACSGTLNAVRVKFTNPDGAQFIKKAFVAQANRKAQALIDVLPIALNAVEDDNQACQFEATLFRNLARDPIRGKDKQDLEPRWIAYKAFTSEGNVDTVRKQIDALIPSTPLKATNTWRNLDGGYRRTYASKTDNGLLYLMRIQGVSGNKSAVCVASALPR